MKGANTVKVSFLWSLFSRLLCEFIKFVNFFFAIFVPSEIDDQEIISSWEVIVPWWIEKIWMEKMLWKLQWKTISSTVWYTCWFRFATCLWILDYWFRSFFLNLEKRDPIFCVVFSSVFRQHDKSIDKPKKKKFKTMFLKVPDLLKSRFSIHHKHFQIKSVIFLLCLNACLKFCVVIAGPTIQQEQELLLLEALSKRQPSYYGTSNSLMDILGRSMF